MKKLIFTDLDGTFLNHDDYSFEPSLEALQLIKEKQIPLIFTTSKTKTEVEQLQKKVGIKEPFIIENGAALFIPKGYQGFDLNSLDEFEEYRVLVLGKRYSQILSFYNDYKDEFGMLGFSDMSLEEIQKYTSLPKENAFLAHKRDFTEPFLLKDETKLNNLKNLALTYNIKITQGGRFFHLIGKNQDKGIAVKKTKELFSKLYNTSIESYGLGDGSNDIAMFENVDYPIAIQNHAGAYVECDLENLQKSGLKGSFGFNEMVLRNVQ
jgi:mannosyl-3-phosphoglycerate phosphatase